jgi:hypothetical protein
MSHNPATLIVAMFLGSIVSPVQAELLPIGGAITPENFSGRYYIQSDSRNNLQFVPDPLDPARKVLELTLARSDKKASGGHRTEIHVRGDAARNLEGIRWYGFEFYVPETWVSISKPIVVAQLHGNDYTVPAPLVSLQIQENRMFLMTQYNTHPIGGPTLPVTANSVRKYPWHGPLEKGRWYRLVMRVLWSSTPNLGEMDIWIDDRRIVSEKNQPNSYDTSGPVGSVNYAKTGVYAPYGIGSLDTVKILNRGIVFGGSDSTYEEIVNGFSQ